MTSEAPIGPAILQAVRFLQGIHKDTHAVANTLDELMVKQGWYPTEANRVSGDLSNGYYASKWLIQSIYRIYANTDGADPIVNMVGCQICLNPPAGYDEPICLCICGQFKEPKSAKQFWDEWDGDGSTRLMEHLASQDGGIRPIPPKELKLIVPNATWGKAFIVKLCQLNSEAAVEKAIVIPLLAAVEGKA